MEDKKTGISAGLVGLLLVVLGIGFLLNSFGWFDFSSFLDTWWPAAIILIGLVQLISRPGSIVFGLIVVTAGIFLQLSNLDILPLDFWEVFWPIVLIIIGLSMFSPRSMRMSRKDSMEGDVDIISVFGEAERRVKANAFRGGRILSVFGGSTLNLRDAKLDPQGAFINVVAVFGGSDIIVPEDWNVSLGGLPLLGALEDKTKLKGSPALGPMLKIRGVAIFGGVSVKN